MNPKIPKHWWNSSLIGLLWLDSGRIRPSLWTAPAKLVGGLLMKVVHHLSPEILKLIPQDNHFSHGWLMVQSAYICWNENIYKKSSDQTSSTKSKLVDVATKAWPEHHLTVACYFLWARMLYAIFLGSRPVSLVVEHGHLYSSLINPLKNGGSFHSYVAVYRRGYP